MQKETLGFQTEVKQLLNLMIHSLYSNKEIFLRELVSNAADAADKLRFAAVSNPALYEGDNDLEVQVIFDKKARTITVSDNGIGMSRDEIIEHLGTIAKSGTREFLAALSGDQAKDARLIGQFGVGFYSSFIVADKVVVNSRRAGLSPQEGVRWESNGEGEFTVEPIEKDKRGTEVILHLRQDEDEFLDDWQLRHIIQKYSDHIALPIKMKKVKEGKEEITTYEFEVVNRAKALWTLPRNEINDEDFKEFYKHISHDFQDPLMWSLNRVEGKQEYISLLYIPAQAPFDLYSREHHRGLKLYVRRVFIMDNAEQFMPMYLRFVKGVIDSNDLPLNISREILQTNKLVSNMRAALVKRVLEMLDKLARDEKEKYAIFWKEFGSVMKEGPAEDIANRAEIASLLRFATTYNDSPVQDVSLNDYVSRMKPDQEKIYYITADSFAAAKHSPHLEIFNKKGIEVLLLSDRVDEWLVSHLTEYAGKPLQSVAKGSLDAAGVSDEHSKEEHKHIEDQYADMLKHLKQVLGDSVKDVRITHRLTESPACLVSDEHDLSSQMHRILKAAGQALPVTKPILELNPEHVFVRKLKSEQDEKRFSDWSHLLFEQAQLAEGSHLDDPALFVRRLNSMLMELI